MVSMWVFCHLLLLCYELQVVLAEKQSIKVENVNNLEDWLDFADANGSKIDKWLDQKGVLSTELSNSDAKSGGNSWFITPKLNLPMTSYLDISASCKENGSCQLEISGGFRKTSKFIVLRNVSFNSSTNSNTSTIPIPKNYTYLRILARLSSKQKFTISSIKIYHYFCRAMNIYGSNVPKVNSSTKNISKVVRCPNNSVSSDGNSTNVTITCTPEGEWHFYHENCECDPGFRFNEQNSTCLRQVTKVSASTTRTSTSTSRPSQNLTTTKSTNAGQNDADDNKMFIFVGVGSGAAFVLIFLSVILLVLRFRRSKSKKNGKDNLGFSAIPLPTIGQKMYVDPSNYDDPEAALKDFANEISPKSLMLERVLGGGEFGDVYKGTLKTKDRDVIEVAAKTLKHDSDERSRKDFFMEASAMAQFDDPNVIHLEGVITKSVPHMIVTEYMSNGSLDHFLKQNDGKLTDLQLVGMARGVASGMKYLAAMHFVHRDLAARNVLVNTALLCKVADFGLSRELETEDSSRGEYCTTGGKIPVRWTAPESIKYRKFSTASDVWSYGILLWEIMSFAERPYWDWDNFKVLERVDEGYRLTAPKNCPKAVHELMLLCWNIDRSDRPEFADIVRMLDEWIRSPETIRYENIRPRPVSGAGINDPAMAVKEWLHDIKMNSYIPHFTQAGFTQLSDLAGLLDNDLQAIGVSLIGHRNKMLRTIRSLPITDQSKKTPWNRSASLKV